jgi:hypothetical protein
MIDLLNMNILRRGLVVNSGRVSDRASSYSPVGTAQSAGRGEYRKNSRQLAAGHASPFPGAAGKATATNVSGRDQSPGVLFLLCQRVGATVSLFSGCLIVRAS